MEIDKLNAVQGFALQIRKDALALLYHGRSGHPGGSLSCADIIACLWHEHLSYSRENWEKPDRNRLILSKGHCVPAIYAAAGRSGLVPPEHATTLRQTGSPLQGHPSVKHTPWVETSTGSLGQGFSSAIGMALGLKHQKIEAHIFAVLGDGEMQEGQVWEGAMSAAHYHLDNICVIVDYNKLQSDDTNENIMGLESLADKWRSFNWSVQEIDGHDILAINTAIISAKNTTARPSIIIANTVKGKGVSFMENVPSFHGSVTLNMEQLHQALQELGADSKQIAVYTNGNFWH